ncbi:hypothetical protein LTS15_010516 [Exophiala xenobiotica]|nr:hypothetical protein LTS15_010516 [Exophiala xenobiotica]
MALFLATLEQAALAVIAHLQQIPEFADEKIAVVGGMGIMRYTGGNRTTNDIDFITTMYNAKEKLLTLPNTPFHERPRGFTYMPGGGNTAIYIDFMHEFQFPYLPDAAVPINTVQGPSPPYISPVDLMVFNIFSCGLYRTQKQNERCATDAVRLLENLANPLVLTTDQKKPVQKGLEDLVRYSKNSEVWWKMRLGLEL